jgi:hypothetical protein
MPAHSASKDARERAYLAGIHVVLRLKKMPSRTKSGHDAALLGKSRDTPHLGCNRKATLRRFLASTADPPQLSPPSSRTTGRGHRRRHNSKCQTEDAMRNRLDSRLPDTAPYKEWLGIVGSMLAAVAICGVLFAGGLLT